MIIDQFTTDNFRLLQLLYDNQSVVLDKKIIPLTQSEISNVLGMSKAKINTMFSSLQESGFISQESRGKYSLLDKGILVVENLKNLEMKLNQE